LRRGGVPVTARVLRAVPFMTAALLAGACSAATRNVASPPQEGAYEIDFLSVRTAVSVDLLQVWLFPGAGADSACSDLTARLRSGQPLPDGAKTTGEFNLCEAFDGKTPRLEAGFGNYSVLVLAKRSGKSWLIGCAQGEVTQESGPLLVSVTPFDATVAIPSTTCTSIKSRCSGSCS